MVNLNSSELDLACINDWRYAVKAGDRITLSGTVYTARDAAHKRIASLIAENKELPFALKGAAVYYAGPTPPAPGRTVGSFGPTTSSRMDVFAPKLIELGLSIMIGKGNRSEAVVEAMKSFGAVYFCAIGGAGALAAKCITSCDVIAFEDLGCESVKRLTFDKFPLICAIDSRGNSLFK